MNNILYISACNFLVCCDGSQNNTKIKIFQMCKNGELFRLDDQLFVKKVHFFFVLLKMSAVAQQRLWPNTKIPLPQMGMLAPRSVHA